MKEPSTEPLSTFDWTRVLAQIEQTLGQSLAQAGETPATRPGSPRSPTTALQQLDERLERWSSRLKEAERNAANADTALSTEVRALEEWLKTQATTREKLTEWSARKR